MSDKKFFNPLTWSLVTKNKPKDLALKINDECFKKIDDICVTELLNKIMNVSNSLTQSKFTLEEYIANTMKKSENLLLVDKYILTYILINNKNNLTPNLIINLLQKNFHFTLINWLCQEKKNLQSSKKFSNDFQIFLNFLSNSVLFFKFLSISPNDLEKFKLHDKLYNIKEFLFDYLKSNNVFLLNSIDFLLQSWEFQTRNFNAQKNFINFIEMNYILGKKTKSPIKNIENNKEDEKSEILGDTEIETFYIDEEINKCNDPDADIDFCEYNQLSSL